MFITALSTLIVPSKSDILSCPATKLDNDSGIQNVVTTQYPSIAHYEKARVYKGRKIIATIGPLTCELCARKCDDAFIALPESHHAAIVESAAIETAISPVWLPILEQYAEHQDLTDDPYSSRTNPVDNKAERIYGEAERVNAIVDSLIDITLGNVLTVGPDGSLVARDAFQLELTEIPSPQEPAPSVATKEPDETGQYRLF